jgi:hypothetical protein
MGVRNYLIDGISGTGKTSVCDELQRPGHHSIHGDRELAYQGDPRTGEPLDGFAHEHHIGDVDKVALVADRSHAASFLCGGFRNFERFRRSIRWSFRSRGRSGHVESPSCRPTARRVGRTGERTGIHCPTAGDERRPFQGTRS